MTNRQQIIEAVKTKFESLEGFDSITYWQDTPTEYSKDHLNFLDTDEDYQPENQIYDAKLFLTIEAIVIESSEPAAVLGNIILAQLIEAINSLSVCGIVKLSKSRKFVETKGKTACLIELDFTVSYKFDR